MKPRDCPKCDKRLELANTSLKYTTEVGLTEVGLLETTHYYHCPGCGYKEQEAYRRQMPVETTKQKEAQSGKD